MADHRMIAGSHERPRGPECRCGADWDAWEQVCVAGIELHDTHWRCWGTDQCAGWVGVDLSSRAAVEREALRHIREEHLLRATSEDKEHDR